jgi:hypothetical protein
MIIETDTVIRVRTAGAALDRLAFTFFLGNRHHRGEQRIVTAKAARWGIVLQGLSLEVALRRGMP